MLVSDNKQYTDKALFLATQARDKARYYLHSEYGYNYRMSNIIAGVGRGQLLHLDEHVSKKQAIYNCYKEAFADIEEITMNPLNIDGEANNWLSCMTIAKECSVTPDDVMDVLDAENIESRPIWNPMHLQPVYKGYDFFTVSKDCESNGGEIFKTGLCLPSDIKNTKEDMEKIINIVRGCFGR